MGRSPEAKNSAPPLPRACGGRFSISGLRNPVSRRFSFFIFSSCFSAYLPRYTPQSSWFGPKKILAPIFLEIFHFLFSKVESASVYASGSKTHVATPPRVPRNTKIPKKILFSFRWWHFFFVLLPKKRVRAEIFFFNLLSWFFHLRRHKSHQGLTKRSHIFFSHRSTPRVP